MRVGCGAAAQPTAGTSMYDLSGRWLSTLHYVTDALGQLQYAHTNVYYEIEQQGDTFAIKKGLHCGDDAIGVGDFAVTADFRPSWEAVASKVSYVGRTGTSVPAADGCMIDFQKFYVVRGAAPPHYLEPANALPNAEDMATDSVPGWENWDGDGNPGVRGVVSGTVSGKIFVAPRQWTSMTGSVPSIAGLFSLPFSESATEVTVGFMVLSQQIGVTPYQRLGPSFDIMDIGVDKAGHADFSRFAHYPIPTSQLEMGRAASPRKVALLARPRQGAGSGERMNTYEVFGLVVKLLDGQLAFGVHGPDAEPERRAQCA